MRETAVLICAIVEMGLGEGKLFCCQCVSLAEGYGYRAHDVQSEDIFMARVLLAIANWI